MADTANGAPWVVWSFEHDAWWGPNHGGYSTHSLAAGIYGEAEAQRIEANANAHSRTPKEKALSLAQALSTESQRLGSRDGRTVLSELQSMFSALLRVRG